ncbi:MAG: hypothetical protein CR988_07295 [Treponema sp.]|nr:MAG: hypothetical protein CR988_07295 [Treponema sp.]
MKKIFLLSLLAVTLSFQLVAGSLDFLKPGEYAYFFDRRDEGEVYYTGITYLPKQSGKSKAFLVRWINLKTKDELIFTMLVDDSTKELRGDKILGEYGQDIPFNNMMKNIAIDFIYMLQFYINNAYRIENDINLIYKAPNVYGRQLATESSPRFKVLRLGKLVENSSPPACVFEIDRMGDLKTASDIKKFKKYMPK